MMRGVSFAILLVLLGACGGSGTGQQAAEAPVQPADFAITPCRHFDTARACAIVRAGGKILLMGAPAGVGYQMTTDDLARLDAVFLFGLSAADVEGLDEVRNLSWVAGRRKPLPVSGPDGTDAFLAALNGAFQTSDALVYVSKKPEGGFDAALLGRGGEVRPVGGQKVSGSAPVKMGRPLFDTGDLQVYGTFWTPGMLAFSVTYSGAPHLLLAPCSARQGDEFHTEMSDGQTARSVSCDGVQGDIAWPVTRTVFIKRG